MFLPRPNLKNLLTFCPILFIIIVDRYIVRCCILKDHFTDEVLVRRFCSGDDDAFEKIAARYLGLISSAAKRYRGMSADIDDSDLVQEGLMALLSACRSYHPDGGMSFKNYLMTCVENRYISLMRSTHRKSAVPMHNIVSIEDGPDTAVDPTESTMSEILETKEYIGHLHNVLRERLSDLEYRVAILHLSGYSYQEIASRLGVSVKSIDNAHTRIRQKLYR